MDGKTILRNHDGSQGCSLLPHCQKAAHPIGRERIAPQGLGNVAIAVAAKQPKREVTQASEGTGIAADAAGDFGLGGIEHMVQPVFDRAVRAHEMGEMMGRDGASAERAQAGRQDLSARDEPALGGFAQLGAATHFDEAEEVVVPRGCTPLLKGNAHARIALLDPLALPEIARSGAAGGRALARVLAQRLVQPGLVGLELAPQVSSAGGDRLDCFFEAAAPCTFKQDMVAGLYCVPWQDQVVHTDGTSCGFAAPICWHAADNMLP